LEQGGVELKRRDGQERQIVPLAEVLAFTEAALRH